ncbi:AraC family transcriptional regulator N-terminal domain-containing protein [Paraburkholderia sp. D1E]|uniref:AraC family transcriptional regulator N-terminal domain-containing protein n=1 Tax=Paraburkholderia sp. D1E TaxID=3461398 RepID=UPI0040452DA1
MDTLAELRTLIGRHAVDDVTATSLPGVVLSVSTTHTQSIHRVYEPVFALVAQGAKRATLGDKLLEYHAGQCLVVTVDLPMCGHVIEASANKPFLAVGLMLKPATIASLLLDTASDAPTMVNPFGAAVGDATPELLDPFVRLLRLLEHPEDLPVLAPMIEREILWRILTGRQGALLRQVGLADSRLSHVGRAIRWIRMHYADMLHTEELAELAAMSVSSFHRHFRAVTAMSPLQYQKQIRLQEARTQLLTTSKDIASVGLSVGYDSASQFSREYSRLFGRPPGQDAQRLRSSAMQARSSATARS